MKFFGVILAGIALGAVGLRGAETPSPPPAVARNAEAEKLIDELVNVSTETVGVTSTRSIPTGRFLAGATPPVIRAGRRGGADIAAPPAMVQLAKMGVLAVPSLLDHLSDARTTKLVIKRPEHWIMYSIDDYDARYPGDPARAPVGVNLVNQGKQKVEDLGDSYTIRVGDLCYVLLGQIVDRSLIAVHYASSVTPYGATLQYIYVTSPVRTPALAAVARVDWAGLTPEQLRASLEKDATTDKKIPKGQQAAAREDARQRLLFYYPEATKVAPAAGTAESPAVKP